MGLKLGSETNSVQNWMMAGSRQPAPEVGMGCTILMWTDRHAATVIKVSSSGKTIEVQEDHARRTDGNGLSEDQTHEFTRNTSGAVHTFRMTKKGWRTAGSGRGLLLGTRDEYRDPTF